MRAVFVADFVAENLPVQISLPKEEVHHLVSVVRTKIGDEVMLLNGHGSIYRGKISAISKRDADLYLETREDREPGRVDLALAYPKREALELVLKMAAEMGISKIWGFSSQFSVGNPLKYDRREAILTGAIKQSNNPWLPGFEHLDSLGSLSWDRYDEIIYFSSLPIHSNTLNEKTTKQNGRTLIIIGPEAGFSAEEEAGISAQKRIKIINLPVPIMRVPTALCVAVGYVLARREND